MPSPNMAINNGNLLPRSSDIGAQIIGHVAKPRRKSTVQGVITSVPTPNIRLALSIPGENMALFRDAMDVPEHANMEDISIAYYIGVSAPRTQNITDNREGE